MTFGIINNFASTTTMARRAHPHLRHRLQLGNVSAETLGLRGSLPSSTLATPPNSARGARPHLRHRLRLGNISTETFGSRGSLTSLTSSPTSATPPNSARGARRQLQHRHCFGLKGSSPPSAATSTSTSSTSTTSEHQPRGTGGVLEDQFTVDDEVLSGARERRLEDATATFGHDDSNCIGSRS